VLPKINTVPPPLVVFHHTGKNTDSTGSCPRTRPWDILLKRRPKPIKVLVRGAVMLGAIAKIAEQKIREDLERVPEELRMSYIILKNAGCPPPEVALKNEILQIEDMLGHIKDEEEKYRQIKKLNYLVTKLNTMRPRPVNFEENQRYYGDIVNKISVKKK
jgi:hypothetical protein